MVFPFKALSPEYSLPEGYSGRRGPLFSSRGFTLIELVLIILIISILSAWIVPKFGTFINEIKISGASKKLVNDIRYAQSRAATSQSCHRLSYTGATAYEVRNMGMACPASGSGTLIKDPLTQGNFTVDLNRLEFSGVLFTLPTGLGGDYVEFDSLGNPYDGGGLLATSKNVVLTAGIQSKTVTIQSRTGQVQAN